jgi:hypothetical protein
MSATAPAKADTPVPAVPEFSAALGDDPFGGIFARLSSACGGNPAAAGLVKVIPSDEICNNFENVVLPNWRQHWFSFHPNPWIAFDFGPRSVSLTAYSLRTYSGANQCGHLRSWVLEGSTDGQDYIALDSQTDSGALNSSAAVATFRFEASPPIRFVRLRLTGPNHAGSDFLVLRGIELFGTFS